MGIAEDLLSLPPLTRREWLAGQDEDDLALIFAAAKADLGSTYGLWRDDPVGFIRDCLGEFLWSKQEMLARAVYDHRRVAVPACHGPGKALEDSTPVLTPTGWVPIGGLRPGDAVIAGDGTPTRVLAVYPQGIRPLWRVMFSDGTWVDADAEHRWATLTRRGAKRGEVVVSTTADLLARGGPRPQGWARARIPTIHPPDLSGGDDRPVDPYVLGVWLGDGTVKSGYVCTPDGEIADEIARRGYAVKFRDAEKVVTPTFLVGGLGVDLRDLGVGHLRSYERVIPDRYLWAPYGDRLALLRGLMDTDGSVDPSDGSAEYATSAPGLAAAVTFLARSVGCQVRVRSRNGPRYSHRGETRTGRDAWRLRITGGVNPFLLPRKAARYNVGGTTDRLVVAIDPVAPAAATCIRVAHPSGTFVVKDFIVTHNTHLAARLVAWWACVHRPEEVQVVTTATNWRQVRTLLWPHIRRVSSRHDLPGVVNQSEWHVAESIVAFGFSPNKYDEAAGQGIHARYLLVIVDEAGGIDPQIGQALDGLMTGDDCHLLAIGNPPTDEEGTWFQRICEGRSGNWWTERLDALSTPNFTGEACPEQVAAALVNAQWVEDVRREYGEESAYYQARVLARFPTASASRVIPAGWIEEAQAVESPAPSAWQRLGVDVASDGGDEMVVAVADGYRLSIAAAWSGADSADQVRNAELILEHILRAEARQRERDPEEKRRVRVKVDATGIGAGTADVLERMRKDGMHSADIVKVIVARSALDPSRYHDQKAEGWWTMRELVRDGTVRLDIDVKAAAQLHAPSYKLDGTGRIQIESKGDLARRGVPSPDQADALILAVYEPEYVSDPVVSRPPPQRRLPDRVGSRWSPG